MKYACLVLATVSLFCAVFLYAAGDDDHTIMIEDVKASDGVLDIYSQPSIHTSLMMVYDKCGCCSFGLWSGGCIKVNHTDLSAVRIGDWAQIIQGDIKLVLECVEIVDCIVFGEKLLSSHGFVHANGDVLIYKNTGGVVTVYRFIKL